MKISLTTECQGFNVSFEWRRNWNRETLTGLPGLDPDLVSSQVDIVPAQSCQISQSLTGVESKEDQASPFFISSRKQANQYLLRGFFVTLAIGENGKSCW